VLAVERHATSKIARADDLAAIVTLGFRGEALPSIASVSRFVLRTRAKAAASGTEVRVEGGVGVSVREVGAPEGTSVEVGDLFFNLPARRKFLKADAPESAQVSRVVTQIALAYPEVGFSLVSGGRRVCDWPPVATRADRFYQVYGERRDLVPVGWDGAALSVSGFVAALAEQGPTRGPQHLYVNRRVVKDRTVAHAILDAYSAASMKERSPEVHLFLEIPPDQVDVNVHPTKAEVRFRDQALVHGLVRRAVAAALGSGPAPEWRLAAQPAVPGAAAPQLESGVRAVWRRWGVPGAGVWGRRGGGAPGAPDVGEEQARRWSSGESTGRQDAPGTTDPDWASSGARSQEPGAAEPVVLPMIPLGQFLHTYIIAVDAEGISIIDQHVAHERVLFEQIMERLATGRVEGQRLLEGLVIALPPGQREALAAHAAELERLGFEADAFGGDSIRVSAAPAWLGRDEAVAVVRAVAADLDGLAPRAPIDVVERRIAATAPGPGTGDDLLAAGTPRPAA
jgi:DNA mismatch repair protein MutL